MPCPDCESDQVFCKDCRHWEPTYNGIGTCNGQGTNSSKFWIEGKDSPCIRLMTTGSFGCRHFEQQPLIAEDVL